MEGVSFTLLVTDDMAITWAAVLTAFMVQFLRANYLFFNSLTEELLHN
jgi:hypothetical protein